MKALRERYCNICGREGNRGQWTDRKYIEPESSSMAASVLHMASSRCDSRPKEALVGQRHRDATFQRPPEPPAVLGNSAFSATSKSANASVLSPAFDIAYHSARGISDRLSRPSNWASTTVAENLSCDAVENREMFSCPFTVWGAGRAVVSADALAWIGRL